MSIQYFAKIKSASDHEKFQQIVRHYPACSFEDWQFRETKKISDWRSRRHSVKMVEISPAEFKEYCERTGARPDLTTFQAVIIEKGERY